MLQLNNMFRFAVAVLLGQAVTALPTHLNITAVAGLDNRSVIQCWQMESPFSASSDAGTTGVARINLSDAINLSYLVVPSAFDGGLHNAPAAQWVVFISGLAEIRLPDDTHTVAIVEGGEFGVIFAADTPDVSAQGHITRFPGTSETVALQIATKDNVVPPHTVLHQGPCVADEIIGLHLFATSS